MVPWVAAARVGGVDPLAHPASYPLTGPGPAPPPVTTLRVVGDVMLGRGVADVSGDDPTAALRPMSPWLRSADLTVGNLESTLSAAGPPQQGDDSFAAPGTLPGLADAGFDALSLANNHTGDFGQQALLRTVGAFRAAGSRRSAPAATGSRRPGRRCWNGTGPASASSASTRSARPRGPPPPGRERCRSGCHRGPARWSPATCAGCCATSGASRPRWTSWSCCRTGARSTRTPPGPCRPGWPAALATAGADLVVGGHPHWVQGLARAGDAVVAHSLGNFVFDMDFSPQTMEGVGLTATFWGDRLVAVDLLPYRLDASFAPHPARGDTGAAVLGDVRGASTGPFAR